MATKHDQILNHIENLPVGAKISVRSIAKNLSVSEGTAYRAIKDAEISGMVSTIQRVGTIRIERKTADSIEILTFGETVNIIEGSVLGGEEGLDNPLRKFIIGAMEEEAMIRYITPGSLMIVGNRENAQRLALENGAAVLITGGFKASPEVIMLANKTNLPIIGTSYDSFTVATMINRAMADQLIKKEVMLIEDIYISLPETIYLSIDDTIKEYRNLNEQSQHSRFPVVNKNMRVVGIVTAKDVIGKADSVKVERVMTRNPASVKTHMSVASVAHLMIWDELEVMPVVKDDLTLIGIISRQDVMKAMQTTQRQPQMGVTISDQIVEQVEKIADSENTPPALVEELPKYSFTVTPQMTDPVGNLSIGVLSETITYVATMSLENIKKRNAVIEQFNLFSIKMIQMGSELIIKPKIFEVGRRSSKLDIEVYHENILVAKAVAVCQMMQRA
ncbi:DRTGG domain-containing protein [Desemzia sp. FAM 23991]|uniref:DRTGG domain-containing protein n=1 Tax=unclassified Desemzia TaxID=2685243 RepID=UPI0038891B13